MVLVLLKTSFRSIYSVGTADRSGNVPQDKVQMILPNLLHEDTKTGSLYTNPLFSQPLSHFEDCVSVAMCDLELLANELS